MGCAHEDSDQVVLTKDAETARRVCSLALEFTSAKVPTSSEQIAESLYSGLGQEAFRKAFKRDRDRLAACGIILQEVPQAEGKSMWCLDTEHTYADGVELEPIEAAALEMACRPLLEDPGFPAPDELRFALGKIGRAFSEAVTHDPVRMGHEDKYTAALWSSFAGLHAARISYTDAKGASSERLIAPYGFFDVSGTPYLVAARVDESGRALDDSIRTYRIDRVTKVTQTRVDYLIPEDFDVADWHRLPFQIGQPVFIATFLVPVDRELDVRHEALGQGSFAISEEGLAWTVEVCSPRLAASWAVRMGIRPVSPEAMVDAWREILLGVVASG